jgi:hypothetical protein
MKSLGVIALTAALMLFARNAALAAGVSESVYATDMSTMQLPALGGFSASISVPASDSVLPMHMSISAEIDAPASGDGAQAATRLSQSIGNRDVPLIWYELRTDDTIRFDSVGTLGLRVNLPAHVVIHARQFYAIACDTQNCRPVQIPLELRGRTLQPPKRIASMHFRFAAWAQHTYVMAICVQPEGERP